LPNHSTEYATISGLSIAARLPTEFIVAPTTPTWLRPISITVPHAAPSVNIVMPVARAMSPAASIGVDEAAAPRSATPAITYATAPSPQRPIRNP
jgi:hypothetical protein